MEIKKTEENVINFYAKKWDTTKNNALKVIIRAFYERRNPGKWPEDLKEGDN